MLGNKKQMYFAKVMELDILLKVNRFFGALTLRIVNIQRAYMKLYLKEMI